MCINSDSHFTHFRNTKVLVLIHASCQKFRNLSLKSSVTNQVECQLQNLIIRKIVDSQIKLIHINKKQKSERVDTLDAW